MSPECKGQRGLDNPPRSCLSTPALLYLPPFLLSTETGQRAAHRRKVVSGIRDETVASEKNLVGWKGRWLACWLIAQISFFAMFSRQKNLFNRLLHLVCVSVSTCFSLEIQNRSGFCFLLNFLGFSQFRFSGPKAPVAKLKVGVQMHKLCSLMHFRRICVLKLLISKWA